MATELATAYISLVPSLRGGTAKIEKELGGVGEKTGKTAGRGFSSAFGKAVSLAAPIAAGAVVLKQVKDVFAAASESRKIAKLTEQVIKTTGGAAKVSADQVADLAGSLAKKTGVDDEVIQSGANLLLTFKNLKDEAGKGNDIFSQTTALANDMSVALGQDMSSSSMQLGKALNDPVKGIAALGRVGVSFTADQKKQIKALAESGDLLAAQKIILAEVGDQFGGAAEAAGTPVDKLKVVVGDLQEQLGEKLLPYVDKFAKLLGEQVPVALAKARDLFERIKPTLAKIAETMRAVAERVRPIVVRIVELVKQDPVPFFAALGVVLGGVVLLAVQSLVASLIALLSPVVLIIAGVAALTAGVIYAYRHFEGFRNVVDTVVAWLVGTAWPAIQRFAKAVVDVFAELVAFVRTHWSAIQEAIGHVIAVVRAVIEFFIATVQDAWARFGDTIMGFVSGVWDFIQRTVVNAITIVRGIILAVLALINGDWGQAWDAIKGVFVAVWDQIKNSLTLALDAVKLVVGGFIDLFGDLPDKLVAALSGLAEKVAAPFKALGKAIKDAWNDTIGGFGFDIPNLPGLPGGGTKVEIPEMHRGGPVTGRSGAEVLRILEAGEWVLSRDQVNRMRNQSASAPVPGMAGAGAPMIGSLAVTTVADATADEVVDAINAKLGWVHTTRRDR